MAKSNGILKQRRAAWLKGVLSRTEEERQDSRWKRLMKRMSRIDKTYLRTHRSAMHIGRNDPCPCGNVYAGTVLKDRHGNVQKDDEGNPLEIPVKFKNCCWHKIHNKQKQVPTQLAISVNKKDERYFEKHRRLPE